MGENDSGGTDLPLPTLFTSSNVGAKLLYKDVMYSLGHRFTTPAPKSLFSPFPSFPSVHSQNLALSHRPLGSDLALSIFSTTLS